MKKKIFLMVIAVFLLSAMLTLASCDVIPTPNISFGGGEDETDPKPDPQPKPDPDDPVDDPTPDPGPDDPIDDPNPDPGPDDPTPEPTIYKVKYYIHLSNGEYKKLFEHKVDAEVGFTEEQLAEKDNIMHDEGYLIDYLYADKAETELFDFSAPLTSDVEIYCGRDMTKAGVNVTWTCVQNKYGGYTLSFKGTGDMYEYYYEESVPWHTYKDKINEVYIPSGITSIADCAFYQFSMIDTVELPDTLVHIGKSAFYQSSISHMIFPNSLRTIGEAAFQDCLGLVHNTFNNGLQHIGKAAFYQCRNLQTMVFPVSLESIGGSAFYNCTDISSVYYLGTEDEYNLIKSYLDNFWAQELAVTYFLSEEEPEAPGPYWYHGKNNSIQQWYNTIWYMSSASAKTPFVRDYVSVADGYNQANIDFYNSIVYHGYKFDYFRLSTENKEYVMTLGDKLTKDIRLVGIRGKLCGDNLKWDYRNNILTISKIDASLDDGAMWDFETLKDAPWYSNKQNIKRIVLSGVTYIGSYAFCDIKDVAAANKYNDFTYIDIPLSVTEINVNAFSGCDNLLYIYYAGTDASAVTGLTSLNTIQNANVYVSALTSDPATLGAGNYWTLVIKGTSINRVCWMYDDTTKTLTVGGGDAENKLPDFASLAETPWASLANEAEKLVISENIIRVGTYAFDGMSSVTSIQAPKRLRIIKETSFTGTAFYNNAYENDGAVYLPTADGVCHLVRINPDKVGELYIIPEKTVTVAEGAFDGCTGILYLVFSKDIAVDAIHSGAFRDLTSLVTLYYWGERESYLEYDKYNPVSLEDLANAEVRFYASSNPYANATEPVTDLFWRWNDPAVKDVPLNWPVPESGDVSGDQTPDGAE